MFYNTEETSLCDICEGEDCNESCKIHAAEQRSTQDHPDIGARSTGNMYYISNVANAIMVLSGAYLFTI